MIKLLVALVIVWGAEETKGDKYIKEQTYLHTAINRTCKKCSPGFYRVAHCTIDDPNAKCEPCPNGTFQTEYNIATSCAPCVEYCPTAREYLVRNCSATTNNACICFEGFYRFEGREGLCTEDPGCPPGKGVSQKGTPFLQTKCYDCPEGYFSPNFSRTQICQPCSQCKDGYVPKAQCSKDRDVECVQEHEIGILPIILGCVGGLVVILLIILLAACLCARKGRGPKLLQKLCHGRDNCDQETKAENHPLTSVDKTSTHSNGFKNGDVLDNPASSNGFITDDLPGVVSDKTLLNLSHDLISQDWQFFFRHLIGESADIHIDETLIDIKGVKEQIYQLLKKWKHIKKESATLDNIVAALRECGKNDLVVKYSRRKSTDV